MYRTRSLPVGWLLASLHSRGRVCSKREVRAGNSRYRDAHQPAHSTVCAYPFRLWRGSPLSLGRWKHPGREQRNLSTPWLSSQAGGGCTRLFFHLFGKYEWGSLQQNWKRKADFAGWSGSPLLCPSWGWLGPLSSLLMPGSGLTLRQQQKITPTSATACPGCLLLKSVCWYLTFLSNISGSLFSFWRCNLVVWFLVWGNVDVWYFSRYKLKAFRLKGESREGIFPSNAHDNSCECKQLP